MSVSVGLSLWMVMGGVLVIILEAVTVGTRGVMGVMGFEIWGM